MTPVRCLAVGVALLAAGGFAFAADPATEKDKEPEQVSYYRHVRPIFQQHCQGCHQPAKPQGGLVMTGYADLLKKGESDKPALVPGKPVESLIFHQITPHDGKPPAMPKGKDPLLGREVNLIKKWIAQGAKDDTPAAARQVVDADHPPTYLLPPVLTGIAYSPDGQVLAVGGYHEVLLHKPDGSGLVGRLIGLSERIQSIAFSPDGKYLAVTGGDPGRFGEVQVWDVAREKLKLSVPVTYDTVYGASWSPDGKKIAFGCGDNTLRAIDAATGQQVLYQGAHDDWVLDTAFTTSGEYLVSVSRDMSMKLTEVATQRFVDNVTSITPGALKGGLQTVALKPKKDKAMSKVPPDTPGAKPHPYDEVLIGGSDGTPRIYKVHRETKRVIGDDANRVREFEPMPGRIFAGEFSPDGTRIVVASSLNGKGEVRVYQTADGKRLSTLQGQKGAVYALAYRPDGKQVASAGFDGLIRLNDPDTGKLIKEFLPVTLTTAGVASGRK
jgi:DNA-binding beta-propeller fold protein YncE/mono/diheme cytochrome c family protein